MKRKTAIPVTIFSIVVVAIAATLTVNKKKIDAANQIVDRSLIPVSVTVSKVTNQPMTINLTLPAILNPYESANISVQTPGIISSLSIDKGSRVAQGEIIGAIDMRVARLNLDAAQLNSEKLKEDYQRTKALYEGNAASKVNSIDTKYAYENAGIQVKQIKQQIANANIVAPISGIINARNLRAGEFVNPGMTIASVVNIYQLKASVYVDEADVYQLHLGETATVTTTVLPGQSLTGKVIFISPQGDDNHNYQVDILLDNRTKPMLKAGTNVNVSFDFSPKGNVLQIPKIALVDDHQRPYVYVINGNRAEGRYITTGADQGEYIQVTNGLKEGDEVVVSGQINLQNGSLITIVNH
ncbi:efflux RND transporter periplasmic adaptor subunit [Microbacter margulisiae]|uniref:RND family efflux transporter MFP subunit n=1 Tax=Microbacter margulisiae TaxID=1350067 RepID=A0A7W5H3I7_9PORP|nr:efflux RND transporter periplasmic adaptor subunit [Microbacter margulisiae]MBB3188511.1 RND family efflux transporter MFP subunit [Microbacter margulisiae]